MAIEQQPLGGQLQGNVLLYSRPEPLNKEQHGNLGISPIDAPFNFARSANAVPLAVTEFGPASLAYPIIFTGSDYTPLAVMSIRQNENLFLLESGYFEQDVYVPAYIRRYPFVLANDEINEKLIVCIERDADAVQVNGEVPLFENGELSAFSSRPSSSAPTSRPNVSAPLSSSTPCATSIFWNCASRPSPRPTRMERRASRSSWRTSLRCRKPS